MKNITLRYNKIMMGKLSEGIIGRFDLRSYEDNHILYFQLMKGDSYFNGITYVKDKLEGTTSEIIEALKGYGFQADIVCEA